MVPSWVSVRFSAKKLLLFVWWFCGTPNSGSGVSLSLGPAFGTLFLLLGCLDKCWYEGLCLIFLHLVITYSVHIPGKSVLFWREMETECICKREKVGCGLEGVEAGGRLWSECITWENNKNMVSIKCESLSWHHKIQTLKMGLLQIRNHLWF